MCSLAWPTYCGYLVVGGVPYIAVVDILYTTC